MGDGSRDKCDSPRFHELLARMQSGSQDAAWELLGTFGPHIQAVVRRFLDRKLRMMYDSEDFVQSVWASLIRRQQSLGEVRDPHRFIVAIARNKVIDEVRRRHGTARHDINRQVSIERQMGETGELTDGSPTPSEWAMARERWEALMEGESETTHRIIELRIAGATFIEIAENLNISERTARRAVKRLLAKFEE